MKVIEVTGIPGSGKSSLIPIIKNHIKDLGGKIYDEYNLIFTSNNPFLSEKIFKIACGIFTPAFQKRIAYKLFEVLYKDKCQTRICKK